MRLVPFRCGLFLLAALLLPGALRAADFYPPLPAAKSAIDFDKRGFLIHGQRTFIASAGIEYARVPRALWRDRLLRIKRSGFNCIEIYAFWNYHEIIPGKFDFTGDKDVGAFLDLAHQLGLYITVRVGPYVCAEWENGGLPMYLRFQPGMRIRQNDPVYVEFVDRWYEHILPIVASRQIERGGGVIMVQLENEDDEGWGTQADNADPYFRHLFDKARALGIDVLTFFSGMNHGGDPAPKDPISSAGRENPWFSTEFWCNWYSQYGAMSAGDLIHFDRAGWRFLENGGNGFNVYMFHGGTNFATWNNSETAASYDYGAAIGQAGDLRPIYYKYKRVALFGRSLQDILEDCDDSSPAHQNDFPGLTIRTRTGPSGTLEFLDNPSGAPVDAHFPDSTTLTVAAGEVVGLVHDFLLDSTFRLTASESRILNVSHDGKMTTLIMYGPVGSIGQIAISSEKPLQNSEGWVSDAAHPGASTLTVKFPATQPEVHTLHAGDRSLRVLAMSSELADNTYIIDAKGGNDVVAGAPYVGEFSPGKTPHFTMETPIDATMAPPVSVYGPAASELHLDAEALHPVDTTAPTLADWKSASAVAEALPTYNDSTWKSSDAPLPMGADGDTGAFAWYRTTLNAASDGTRYLQVPYIGDHAIAFVNGKRINGTFGPGPTTIPIPLQSGPNPLAILVSHSGRSKLISTYGAIDRLDMKGLVGPVRLLPVNTPSVPIEHGFSRAVWPTPDRVIPPLSQVIDPNLNPAPPDWDPRNFTSDFEYTPGTWRNPWVCIRATLPDIAGPDRVLHAGLVDEKATFYLNGQKIGEQDQPDSSIDLPLGATWKEGGPNQLAVILENPHSQATIGLLALTSGAPGTEVKGWKMRGGLAERTSRPPAWKEAPATAPSVPTYYHTKFDLPDDYYTNATPILRLSSKGLSRGFAWLNGHNLGRYPEKLQLDGLYLPECWLKSGTNDLIVLDEEGAAIAPEKLYVETAASRRRIER